MVWRNVSFAQYLLFLLTGVPEGFFDSDVVSSKPQEAESLYSEKPPKPKHPPKPNTSEALPEGFFDDPVADAKVRFAVWEGFLFKPKTILMKLTL